MSTVYVVQCPKHKDAEGNLVDKYNLEPAKVFGDLQELLTPYAKPFAPKVVIDELYQKLDNFTDHDYILCIGNPILMSLAVTVATDINNGRVKLLQWHGHTEQYIPIAFDLEFPENAA